MAARDASSPINLSLGGGTDRNVTFSSLAPDELELGIFFGFGSIGEALSFSNTDILVDPNNSPNAPRRQATTSADAHLVSVLAAVAFESFG